MGDAFKKVRPGQGLEMPARAYNAFVDAAQAHKGQAHALAEPRRPAGRNVTILPVKNSSGADRGRFDVLGISDLVYDPTDNLDEFKNNPAIDGVTPATASHAGKFVILLEAIPSGKIGRGLLVGVTPVKVNFSDATHTHADVENAQAGRLASGSKGAVRILWKEAGTGEKWALVKLGTSASELPVGTGDGQVLYWDNTSKTYVLSAAPANPTTKDYVYVWDHTTETLKPVEIGAWICT